MLQNSAFKADSRSSQKLQNWFILKLYIGFYRIYELIIF